MIDWKKMEFILIIYYCIYLKFTILNNYRRKTYFRIILSNVENKKQSMSS